MKEDELSGLERRIRKRLQELVDLQRIVAPPTTQVPRDVPPHKTYTPPPPDPLKAPREPAPKPRTPPPHKKTPPPKPVAPPPPPSAATPPQQEYPPFPPDTPFFEEAQLQYTPFSPDALYFEEPHPRETPSPGPLKPPEVAAAKPRTPPPKPVAPPPPPSVAPPQLKYPPFPPDAPFFEEAQLRDAYPQDPGLADLIDIGLSTDDPSAKLVLWAARCSSRLDEDIARYAQSLSFAHTQKGWSWYWRGEWDSALPEIDAALMHDPRNVSARLSKGDIAAGRRQMEEALRAYVTVQQVDPSNADAKEKAGAFAAYAKALGHPPLDLRKLHRDVEKECRSWPPLPATFAELSLAWCPQERDPFLAELAKKYHGEFLEASRKGPRHPGYAVHQGFGHELRAYYYELIGADRDAVREYQAALLFRPELRFVEHRLGDISLRLGDKGEAKRNYEGALIRDPSDDIVREKLKKLRGSWFRR